jgi:hypothetical protein
MKTKQQTSDPTVNKGRHEYQCRICSHPHRVDIEQAFVNWASPTQISKKYSFSRDGVYRHAHVVASHAEWSRTEEISKELS